MKIKVWLLNFLIIFLKIYLLKKEEEEEKYIFFPLKKHIFLPSGKYLEKFPVEVARVTQREFCINM